MQAVKTERSMPSTQNMRRMWWTTPGDSSSWKRLLGIPNTPSANLGQVCQRHASTSVLLDRSESHGFPAQCCYNFSFYFDSHSSRSPHISGVEQLSRQAFQTKLYPILCFCVFETLQPKLASNLKSFCFSFPTARITNYYPARLLCFYKCFSCYKI